MTALLLAAWAAWAGPSAEVFEADFPIKVDGVLDEPAWATATPVTDFQRYTPTIGGPPAGTTEVRFLQDDRALYIGIEVRDSEWPIRARISPRERINADDQVGLYLDTFHDGRTGYIFYFNALGVQQDIRHNNGVWNVSWNTAYRSRGAATERGYTIEIALPFRSIKFPRSDGAQTWGLVLTRKIPREGAKYGWPRLQPSDPFPFRHEGELRGVRPPRRGSGVELIPTLTMRQDWPREGTGEPFTGLDGPLDVVRPSLDARYGITPNVGLTAALNPDFAQVESDVGDVRLNPQFAFEFPEQRPFFLDGVEFFQDRQRTLYTRSIEAPLYGVKVAGREGGASIGVLHALDATPRPSLTEGGAPGFGADDVDGHMALNSMLRARLDAFGTGSLGFTIGDKQIRPADGAGGGAAWDGVGADLFVPLGDRWQAGGSTLHTVTGGADYGSISGSATEVSVARVSGVGTGAEAWLLDRTEDMRAEMGFLPRAGGTEVGGSLDHTFAPSGAVDTVAPGLSTAHYLERNDGVDGRVEGDRYNQVDAGIRTLIGGVHDLRASFGGRQRRERDVRVTGASASASYSGQLGPVLYVAPSVELTRDLDFASLTPARSLTGELDVTLRPTPGIRLDATGRLQQLVPEGGTEAVSRLARGRWTWQFTQPLGVRVVSELRGANVDAIDARWLNSVLLTWLEVPGTAVYVGLTDIADPSASMAPVERVAFLKASVLLRP